MMELAMDITPVLHVTYSVVAYDESGYGDNRSKNFTDGKSAVSYAQRLEPRFGAVVWKRIEMEPITTLIDITARHID